MFSFPLARCLRSAALLGRLEGEGMPGHMPGVVGVRGWGGLGLLPLPLQRL